MAVISARNHDYLWYYIGEFDDIMLISDLMRWLRVDLFFERSKRFIRWFIRLLPLRKINEELWFFNFFIAICLTSKIDRLLGPGFLDGFSCPFEGYTGPGTEIPSQNEV